MARPWEAGWTTAQPAIESAAGAVRASGGSASRSLPVQRINLLEAAVLDDEIFYLLESTFAAAFFGTRAAEQGGYGAGAASSGVFSPRALLRVAVRSAVLSFTVLANRPTPGQLLQNVRYRDERKFIDPRTAGLLSLPGDRPTAMQRVAWMVLNVVSPYAWPLLRHKIVVWGGQLIRQQLRLADRVNSEYGEEESSAESKEMGGVHVQSTLRERLAAPISAAVCRVIQFFVGASAPEVAVGRGLDFLEALWGLASLTNLLVFMRSGVYSTLVNRLLYASGAHACWSIPFPQF